MNRRARLAALALTVPGIVVAACSSDDSATGATGDGGSSSDGATTGDASTNGDGSTTQDGSASGDSAPPPPVQCGGAGPGSFSGDVNHGSPAYVSGYSVFYDGLVDAGIGAFSVSCALTDAGLVSGLPCPVGVSTVQHFPNDGLTLTLNPSAMDAAAATLTATVGDD
jgi:hypothetical protein